MISLFKSIQQPLLCLGRIWLVLVGIYCLTQGVNARTIEVCPSCEFHEIKTAVSQAVAGDVVLVKPGLYEETGIVIHAGITLKGEGWPVIDGTGGGEIITIDADSVTIEGLEVRNTGINHIEDIAAIRVKRRDYFNILNNRVVNAFFGIYIENGEHGTIAGNILLGDAENEMNTGNAIHCWYAEYLDIRYNKINRYRDGIYLEFVHNSVVEDNVSEDNIRYGLHFMFSNDDVYQCNFFKNNGAGVAVMFSRRIQMLENVFSYNWGASSYGLLLKEIYDAEILRNKFDHNTIGILLEGSTRLDYQYNEFSSNGWAVQMSGGCLDNNFMNNNFLSNTLDLVLNGRVNNNSFNGNYWSDYAGYDLEKDGIGDVPHRPVSLYGHILDESPESIILLRSFFVDLLNYSEKVSPVFTPEEVEDEYPLMQIIL